MSGLLLVEFATVHETLTAARRAADAGHLVRDVISPNPVEGASEHLAPPHRRRAIGWVMFAAGAAGALIGYAMQWYSAVIDYPINTGGRPLNSWPAFMLVPYETAILFAAVIGVLGWMWMCGLPRLHHPFFVAEAMERAMQDRYLLVFDNDDGLTRWIEVELQPCALHEIDP